MMREVRDELKRGIALFNGGAYFEAHEALEAVWLKSPPAERLFVQALIHFAVGWHHAAMENFEGAVRQLEKGLKKLAGYLPERHGVMTLGLYEDGLKWLGAWRRSEAAEGRAKIGVKA